MDSVGFKIVFPIITFLDYFSRLFSIALSLDVIKLDCLYDYASESGKTFSKASN